MSSVSTVQSDLSRVDPLDIAAGCAALRTMPENWQHLQRLHGLASHALQTETRTTVGAVDHSRWRRWLVDSPSLSKEPRWDPPEGTLTEPIMFFGGDYVLPTEGDPSIAFSLQHVLDVLAFGRWDADARLMREEAFRLARAVLKLASAASAAAGASRYAPALRDAKRLAIPSSVGMRAMTRAFSFEEDELTAVIGADLALLGPLEHDLATGPLRAQEGPIDPLCRTPVVRREGRRVLAGPHFLGVALRYALIGLIVEHGFAETFGEFSARRAMSCATAAAERMDWEPVQALPPTDAIPLWSALFSFDDDKVTHLVVISDDLADFDPARPHSDWRPDGVFEAFAERAKDVELGVTMGPGPRANELLHVMILAGVGRYSGVFGLPYVDTPAGSPALLFTAEAFDRITMLAPDQLELWKFAKAGESLREYAHVVAFDPLDEYALWRDNDRSYYMDDDGRPTAVMIDPSHGYVFREEVARVTDVHALRTPRCTTEAVVRLHSTGEIPIYAPLHDLAGRPRLATVTDRHVVWTQGEEERQSAEHHRATHAMVDCIAYWMWQVGPALPELAWHGIEPLVIDVVIDEPLSWSEFAAPGPTESPTVTVVPSGELELTVTIHAAMAFRLDGPTNEGERELIRALLEAISELETGQGGPGVTASEIDEALERYAPLGSKKKLNFFHTGEVPTLRTGPLPDARLRQDADSSCALDEMAQILLPRLDRPVGPVPVGERTTVLNAAVETHYQLMCSAVAALRPDGLLEELVARHEALLRREELQRRQLGSRIACFEETTLVEDFIKQVPETTTTAVALRFLIEYVAARPPSGLRPMSLAVYDYLIAHAAEIVNRGMASDVLNSGLDDFDVSILAAQRLGMKQDTRFRTGQQAFLQASMPVLAERIADSFADHWDTSDPEQPDFLDELDEAARAEFGFTQREFGAMTIALVDQAEKRGHRAVAVERREVLVADLAKDLEWQPPRVEEMLGLLTLRPRSGYLKPDPPYRPSDVYPWQFNRKLSYLRRPLIERTIDGNVEVLWGLRHAWEAGHFLLSLVLSERLDARSLEMQNLMTELRQRETDAFNERIAQLGRDQGLVVRKCVDKIGALKIARNVDGRREPIGDIDVLAADSGHRILYLLECKALNGARTPVELKNEINHTFRVGGEKRSKLEIHLERIEWIRQHLDDVLQWLGLDGAAESWTLDGRMITNIEVLAPHILGGSPIPVQSAANLKEEWLQRRNAS
jgi:hypothetical protein